MWTIFNEGWGQYDAKRLYGMVKKMDSSRLIDPTSGWYDQGLGEVRSHHNYFKKFKYQKDKLNRATLISEFGGFSFGKSKTPYKKFKSEKEFLKQLKELIQRDVKPYIDQGLVGYVYTQYNDVENEQNGLVDKHRVLNQPEYEFSNRSSKNAFYVIGVDVGRIGCTSEACIFKVTPQPQGSAVKTLVNIYTFEE
jgi:hypothetical protein